MRGERDPYTASANSRHGSSPLARGTGRAASPRSPGGRFIPACAGNGWSRGPRRRPAPVHPRLRGERLFSPNRRMTTSGSSPLARGTVHAHRMGAARARFIPACAGNGRSSRSGRPSPPVHPRLRGERDVEYTLNPEENGSSPLARGTAAPGRRQPTRARFIPACAGNGPPTWIPSTPTRGSSPLARGTGLYPGT